MNEMKQREMIHEKEWQGLPCHLTLHNNVVKLRSIHGKIIDKNFKHEYSC